MKKIVLFFMLLLVNWIFLSFAEEAKEVEWGTIRLSLWYQSESVCESSKNSNNSNYWDFVRSSCLQSGSLYYYYICEKTNNFCANVWWTLDLQAQNTWSSVLWISANGNKYLSSIPTKILPKLNKIVIKLKWLSLPRLRSVDLKLRKAAIKYKDQPGLLNIIHFLQFETSSFITAKLSTDWIDWLLCEVWWCDNESVLTWSISLIQQDTRANWYWLGSMRTLTGEHKWNTVHIIDKWFSMHTVIPNGNGLPFDYIGNKLSKKYWDKYVKSLKNDDMYSIRAESPEKWKAQIIDINHQYFQRILQARIPVNSRHKVVLSWTPWNIVKSEFTWKCGVTDPNRKDLSRTKITIYPLEKRKFYVDKYWEEWADIYCYIPTWIKYYINVKADKDVVKNCNQPENSKYKCLLNVWMSRFKNYKTLEAKERQDFYSRNLWKNSPMEELPEELTVWENVKPVWIWLSTLAQQDTKANWYGFWSNKTLKWMYKGREVLIVDSWNGLAALPSIINGRNLFPFYQNSKNKSLISWKMKTNEVYSIRMKTRPNYGQGKYKINPGQRFDIVKSMFPWKKIYWTKVEVAYSKIPGKTTDSEFEWNCEYKWNPNRAMLFGEPDLIAQQLEWNSIQQSIARWKCSIPENTYFYLNIRATSQHCDKENILCPTTLENASGILIPWEDVSTIIKKNEEFLDPDALFKFHNDYWRPFASKKDLEPQILENGKKLYIVNQWGGDTSVPNCVNGKSVSQDCAPSGWNSWITKNEIYSIRLKTDNNSKFAGIRARTNTFSWWKTREGKYRYVLSNKPGDMGKSPFNGKCIFDKSKGSKELNPSFLINDNIVGTHVCNIPNDTIFYLNMELLEESNDFCEKWKCDSYLLMNGLALAKNNYNVSFYWYNKNKELLKNINKEQTNSTWNTSQNVPTSTIQHTCHLKDGTITDYSGPFYDKTNGCKQDVEIRGCSKWTLWNGGFSPAYSRNDVHNFYKNKDKCLWKTPLSTPEILNFSNKIGANSFQYKIDYTNLSNLKVTVSRSTKSLVPNNVSKTFNINFNKLSKQKCSGYLKWWEWRILSNNKYFQTYFKFCKESDGRLWIYHRVKWKNSSGTFVFWNIVLRHGKVKLIKGSQLTNKWEKITAPSITQQPVQNPQSHFSCRLRDGIITSYGGPFYDLKDSCKKDTEIRECEWTNRLWNGWFSPAYSRNSYDYYKNQSRCLQWS